MPADIPRNDPDLPEDDDRRGASIERLEQDVLEAERLALRLGNRETSQRLWLKWVAVVTGVSVISLIGWVAWSSIEIILLGPPGIDSAAFTVALVTVPTLSITSITVALFVAAFGRSKSEESEAGSGLVTSVLDRFTGG